MAWSPSNALRDVRQTLKLNQTEFGERLTVTPSHISLIEAEKSSPSKILLKLASYEFGVNFQWLETGEGEPFQDPNQREDFEKYKNKEEMKKRIIITAAFLVPLLPAAATGFAIGVGVEEILDRMKIAYGAKTMSELAKKFLKTDASAISRWKSQGKIPEKYLEQLPGKTGRPIEYFVFNEKLIKEGRKEIINFIKGKIIEDREMHLDIDEIEAEFEEKFPLQMA